MIGLLTSTGLATVHFLDDRSGWKDQTGKVRLHGWPI